MTDSTVPQAQDIQPAQKHYAVLFSSQLDNDDGYEETAMAMVELAKSMPGFLGVESVRDQTGKGITICYWETLDDIKNWKNQDDHASVQTLGKNKFYASYEVKICEVLSQYSMEPK